MSEWCLPLLWYVAIPLWVVFVAWQGVFSRHARSRWKRAWAKSFSIDTFPEGGYGKVVGNIAHTEDPLIAPYSKRPCIYYSAVVEESYLEDAQGEPGGRRVERWRTLSCTASQCQDFVLKRELRQARVCGEGAQVAVDAVQHYETGSLPAANPSLAKRMFSAGLSYEPKRRYREGALVAGAEVTVCGVGTRKSGQLVLAAAKQSELSVTDH